MTSVVLSESDIDERNDIPSLVNFTDVTASPTSLSWEPSIIKARGGLKLWQVIDNEEVKRMCKSQLKVVPSCI